MAKGPHSEWPVLGPVEWGLQRVAGGCRTSCIWYCMPLQNWCEVFSENGSQFWLLRAPKEPNVFCQGGCNSGNRTVRHVSNLISSALQPLSWRLHAGEHHVCFRRVLVSGDNRRIPRRSDLYRHHPTDKNRRFPFRSSGHRELQRNSLRSILCQNKLSHCLKPKFLSRFNAYSSWWKVFWSCSIWCKEWNRSRSEIPESKRFMRINDQSRKEPEAMACVMDSWVVLKGL